MARPPGAEPAPRPGPGRRSGTKPRNPLTNKGLCPIFSRSRSPRIPVRPTLAVIAILMLAPAALAADAPEVRLSALLQAERAAASPTAEDGAGAVLAAAAGVDLFPVPCATTVILAAQNAPGAAPRPVLTMLAAPPWRADDRVIATRDGRFLLRVPNSGSARLAPAGPEVVARIAEALVAARAYLVGTLGYPDPAPVPDRVTVILAALGRGLEGYILP